MRQFDAIALGECLVDCIAREIPDASKITIEGNAGGAPCNVMVAMTRLGSCTGFIGKVGNDLFGRYLADLIRKSNVDCSGLCFTDKPTTLAIVSLDETGNRSFGFYREQTADVSLCSDDVDTSLIDDCRIFHFGTVSMTAEPSRSATLYAAEYAKSKGKIISFDPNLRPQLWGNLDDARNAIVKGMALADYVKLSAEEQEFITGECDPIKGGEQLAKQYGFPLLAVTMGAQGLAVFHDGRHAFSYSYDVKTVDTTGAGDAMWGATLAWLLKNSGEQFALSDTQMQELVEYANAAGSCCTTRYGAITAMPDEDEIRACIKSVPKLILKNTQYN